MIDAFARRVEIQDGTIRKIWSVWKAVFLEAMGYDFMGRLCQSSFFVGRKDLTQ
jgi:hypothetical protein